MNHDLRNETHPTLQQHHITHTTRTAPTICPPHLTLHHQQTNQSAHHLHHLSISISVLKAWRQAGSNDRNETKQTTSCTTTITGTHSHGLDSVIFCVSYSTSDRRSTSTVLARRDEHSAGAVRCTCTSTSFVRLAVATRSSFG